MGYKRKLVREWGRKRRSTEACPHFPQRRCLFWYTMLGQKLSPNTIGEKQKKRKEMEIGS